MKVYKVRATYRNKYGVHNMTDEFEATSPEHAERLMQTLVIATRNGAVPHRYQVSEVPQ